LPGRPARSQTLYCLSYPGSRLKGKEDLSEEERILLNGFQIGEPGSSVSTESAFGLDDREIEVRSPAEAEDFPSSRCVQTGSEAHPASCTMGTGGPFLGAKARPGRDADHSPPSSAEVVNEELYPSPPPQVPTWRVVSGRAYALEFQIGGSVWTGFIQLRIRLGAPVTRVINLLVREKATNSLTSRVTRRGKFPVWRS
jgi:hypothetical protein